MFMVNEEVLSNTYMLVSLVGFIASSFLLDKIPTWAFTFMVMFIIMFIASIISMSKLPYENKDLIEKLAIHYKKKK